VKKYLVSKLKKKIKLLYIHTVECVPVSQGKASSAIQCWIAVSWPSSKVEKNFLA
jgi:hypothetical protein